MAKRYPVTVFNSKIRPKIPLKSRAARQPYNASKADADAAAADATNVYDVFQAHPYLLLLKLTT